jgi:hypothetical protein
MPNGDKLQLHIGEDEVQYLMSLQNKDGYTDFGCSVVFEQGDVNLNSFTNLVKANLEKEGVKVDFDEEDILYPADNSEFSM